ncbi:MAG: hypothetical protein AAGA03_04800 [Planctomycetota bacterium]
MKRVILSLAGVFSFVGMLGDLSPASGQGFFDQIGRQLGGQLEREIRRAIPGRQISPPADERGPARAMSDPNESGVENTNPGRFLPDDFFTPQQPPRQTFPRQPPRQVIPPQQQIPRQTFPQQPVQGQVIVPSQSPAPPVRTADVSGQSFKLRCPASVGRSVSYQLLTGNSSFPYTMGPGQAQTINETRVWRVRYTSGGKQVTYRLRGGRTYEFDFDPSGQLQLYQAEMDPEPPIRG